MTEVYSNIGKLCVSFWECKGLLEEKNLLVKGGWRQSGILKEVYFSKMFPYLSGGEKSKSLNKTT